MPAGIRVLVIDPFPPTSRDPQGIHKAIRDEIEDEPFDFPNGKDRLFVSYEAGDERTAYIEAIGIGDNLPEMPLFLALGTHIKTPLEETCQATWEATLLEMRRAVETGVLPEPDSY